MMMYLGDLGGGAANGSNLRFSYGNDPQEVGRVRYELSMLKKGWLIELNAPLVGGFNPSEKY